MTDDAIETDETTTPRCRTCAAWSPPDKREGFGNVVRFDSSEDFDAAHQRGNDEDRKYGECTVIHLAEALPMDQEVPLAVTQDGSNYVATLYTQAEFGCVMWRAIEEDA